MNNKKNLILGFVMIAILISTTAIAKSNDWNFEKALSIFKEKEEVHVLTEEQFMKEIETRDSEEVLFASSIAKAYNLTIEEVYTMLDDNNHDTKKVHEILIGENSGRTTPLYLPSRPTEEEAIKITESLKNGKLLSDPRGNFIDNSSVRAISKETVIKTYNEAKFLYAFDEETLMKLLEARPAGEVLHAGNMAHNFKMTVEYVLSVFDEYKGDYHSAYDQLYDEWMAYEQEYNN